MIWNASYKGTKSEVIAASKGDEGIPEEVKAAIRLLMEAHDESPGFTDEDPGAKAAAMSDEQWQAAAETLGVTPGPKPRPRSETIRSYWLVTTIGGPEKFITCDIKVEAMYEVK